ncbi:MAG: 16S rRNA (cytidine(1402)-2'-O)-methyltransferase [Gammaproteobacteria bacterium]|nr:16S rRNA (cytidine(1402)-2'-O)-methyltransferase [Gammaproteobacteria bacterium]
MTGSLYVVATPLGNLGDMSARAIDTLRAVALICAEDTRHSHRLCAQFGIDTPLVSLHDFNERERLDGLLARLVEGENLALISDAGTPLISDPGYRLVRAARQAGVAVYAIPGPSALTAALSVAGIPTDRFVFEGFLPAQAAARRAHLATLAGETRTLVFYESPHRLSVCLADMVDVFGADREAAVIREITKRFEEGRLETLGSLHDWAAQGVRGECVIVVGGAPQGRGRDEEALRVLTLLLRELPLRQAVSLASHITGVSRKGLYAQALSLKDRGEAPAPPDGE